MSQSRQDKVGEVVLRAPQPELGDQLKCMFGELTSGPLPPRLVDLADALEEAFQRGDLFETSPCRSRRAL